MSCHERRGTFASVRAKPIFMDYRRGQTNEIDVDGRAFRGLEEKQS